MQNNRTFSVDTQIVGSTIVQQVTDTQAEIMNVIHRQILNTQDEGIKSALIKMGWTQPSNGLMFCDALRLANGCFDYMGGHRGDDLEIYHHGIQTVINVLSAALEKGLSDSQVAATFAMGGKS